MPTFKGRSIRSLLLPGVAAVLGLPASLAGELSGPLSAQPSEGDRAEFYVPLLLNGGETRTGIAVTNPADVPAVLTFEAYAADGSVLWEPVQWNDPAGEDPDGVLLPGHQRSLEAWQIFGAAASDERQGWLRITSDNPAVKAVYQYFTADLTALDGMNAAPAAQKRLLPPWVLTQWPDDAGDYNKYTNWTASYIIELFRAWEENPAAFGDDYNLPDSGNGLPDIIDEALWGLAWLVKMQQEDGSLLSVMGLDHASPPSAAKGPSYYGDASTSATLSGAAAFAYSAKVLRKLGRRELDTYADELGQRALDTWEWAEENPNVLFHNNSREHGTSGLAAGQQEVNDYGRFVKKLAAACYLFEVIGQPRFREYFEANFRQTHLFRWTFAYPFEQDVQDVLLYYSTIPGATAEVRQDILEQYRVAMQGGDNRPPMRREVDPYRAHLKDYAWGSNGVKARKGTMFYSLITYGVPGTDAEAARHAAERYIHYLHGVNPLGFVYLSNMYAYGAERGVNEFYHSWFTDGSPLWDRVGVSTYGPAPGFLTGGPNPFYDWDDCCPSGCGSPANNAKCWSEPISPPKGQPPQKSYKDFNTSWPLNSWSVTENSCGYEVAYIRLLSKFVRR